MLSRISLRSSGLRHPTTKNLSPPLHHTLSSPSPRPPRGRFMRRSWSGTNRRSGVEIRACQIRWLVLRQILGIPAGAAPAPAASHAAVPGGLGAPPGITTGPCREPADREVFKPQEKRGPRSTKRRSGAPVGAAAFAKAAPHRKVRLTQRAPSGASLPLMFEGTEMGALPDAPRQIGPAERWLSWASA